MSLNFSQLVLLLKKAQRPEDIFGPDMPTIHDKYCEFVKICHPDFFIGDISGNYTLAVQATSTLNQMYAQAKELIKNHCYGKTDINNTKHDFEKIIMTTKSKYHLFQHLATGDIANVFLADYNDGKEEIKQVILKTVQDSDDNDLMINEKNIYQKISEQKKLQDVNTYGQPFLKFIEQFEDGEGNLCNAIEFAYGFDMYALKDKFPKGVSLRHGVWMLLRALRLLGFCHNTGILHGNLNPSHFIVNPAFHLVNLIDFTGSFPIETGKYKFISKDFAPKEISATRHRQPQYSDDIYSLGKIFQFLLDKELDTAGYLQFKNFIDGLCPSNPDLRPRDAFILFHKLTDLRPKIFGPIVFEKFII